MKTLPMCLAKGLKNAVSTAIIGNIDVQREIFPENVDNATERDDRCAEVM